MEQTFIVHSFFLLVFLFVDENRKVHNILKMALKYGYDIAIQHDGDGQHDPAYIGKTIQPILEGKADIVIGSRFLEKKGFQSSTTRRAGKIIIIFFAYLNCIIL